MFWPSIGPRLFLGKSQLGLPLLDMVQKAKRPIFFEKSSLKNQVRRSGFLTCKINFKIDFCWATQTVKIQFVELDFSNMIFQKANTHG
jgi:hypothetical protein